MKVKIAQLKSQQSGISLILSIVILMAIFGLVIVVADVAFDIRATNKAIGSSEIALFAAESAAELTIYEIEKNQASIDLTPIADQTITLPSGNVAYWNREVKLATSTPGLCNPADPTITPSPACTANLGVVNTSNPLLVTLRNTQSFQLDLDIKNATSTYPVHVNIDIGAGGSRLIVSGEGTQTTYTSGNITVPVAGVLEPEDDYKIRIINESGATRTYTISTQNNVDELPLGLQIRTFGRYLDTERDIVLIRPAWLIY